MGLMDQVTGALGGASGEAKGGVNAILVQQLISMLSKPGALQNLIGAFQSNGLGNIVQSRLGSGANLPIQPSQLTQVLGSGTVGELKKAGISEPETANALSGLLPQVIDKPRQAAPLLRRISSAACSAHSERCSVERIRRSSRASNNLDREVRSPHRFAQRSRVSGRCTPSSAARSVAASTSPQVLSSPAWTPSPPRCSRPTCRCTPW